MLWKILMAILFAASCTVLGALIALGLCSRRRWCPRYLRRQLDSWRRLMEKQNKERHKGKPVPEQTTPPPDEAA